MESSSQQEFNRLLIRKQPRPERLDRVEHRSVLDGVSLPTRRVLAFPRLGSMTSNLGGGPLVRNHVWTSLHFRNCNFWFPKESPNLLLGCDFRKTRLIDVEFRNIDLDLTMFPIDDDPIALPRGPLDWLEWGALTGHTWFAEQMANVSGTPTITRLSELRPEFSDDDIRKLAEVAATEARRT